MTSPRLFVGGERGDRLHPKRFSRVYWHLRLLADQMAHVARADLLRSGDKLLDYGCGNQPYRSLFASKFSEYIGADFSGNPDADVTIGPRGELPIENGSIDCVLSSQVLEHTANPEFYLAEACRVLKPGGSLVLCTPEVWIYHPDPLDYWRWTLDGLQRQISDAGFEVLLVRSVFGTDSSALQLWQDTTVDRLPSLLQPLYTAFFQMAIGLLERRRTGTALPGASAHVVLARKVAA
jgi:SAM-dependent methyltransferase